MRVLKNRITKNVLVLIGLVLLFTSEALAQGTFIARRNDNAATVQILTNGSLGALAADQYGKLYTILTDPSGQTVDVLPASNAVTLTGIAAPKVAYAPVTFTTTTALGTTTTVTITGIESTARAGDVFLQRSGANQNTASVIQTVSTNTLTLANAMPSAVASGVTAYILRPQFLGADLASTSNFGVSSLQVKTANEDAGHSSGDPGLFAMGVRQDTPGTVCGNDGDYCQISVTGKGSTRAAIQIESQDTNTSGLLKLEDVAVQTGDAGVAVLYKILATPVVQAADGDYTLPLTDSLSKLWTAGDQIEDAVAASGDRGSFALGVTNESAATVAAANNDYSQLSTNSYGALYVDIISNVRSSGTQSILKIEDVPAASGDALVGIAVVRNDNRATTLCGTDGDYCPIGSDSNGGIYLGFGTFGPMIAEDSVAGNGDGLAKIAAKIVASPVAQAGDGDYGTFLLNDLNATYTDGVRRATFTHTQPSVITATSFTCAAANTARRMVTIQNNSAANIMINLNNGTLTGIVPTSTNLGIVLTPGSSYTTPANAAPTAAITCYQTSGGTINTISVTEQS